MTPRTRRSSWPIVKELCGNYTKWFAFIWLCQFVVISLVIAACMIFNAPTSSIFDNATMGPRYWVLSFGTVLTFISLRMYVAHGVPRRSFIVGGTVTAVVASGVASALTALSYYSELKVYQAQGWDHTLSMSHVFTRADQFGMVFAETALVYTAHFFAGWLLGSLFYRIGVWALPFVLPVYGAAVAVEAALGTGWIGVILDRDVPDFAPSSSIAALVGLCLIAGLAVANWAVLRSVAIAPKKS